MKLQLPETFGDALYVRYLLSFIVIMSLFFAGEPDLLDTLIDILRKLYLGK